MKKILSLFIVTLAGYALADGPVTQTTPYTQTFLQSQNAAAAQTALNLAGVTSLTVVSNTAAAAMVPQMQTMSNTLQFAVLASTNAGYGMVNIKQFGAYVDGYVFNGCYCSNGTTLYDPLGRFTAAQAGLYCWLRFGGTNGAQDWLTTIQSYTSPNVLVLSTAPASETFNLPVAIGHDDSSAWQTAFNFYGSLGASVNFFVPLNPLTRNTYGISMICTNFTDVGDWRSHWNAQLHAPNIAFTGASDSPVWTFRGATVLNGGSVLNGSDRTWWPVGSQILCCQPWGSTGSNWLNNFNFCGETGGSAGDGSQHFYGFNNLSVFLDNIQINGCYNDGVALFNCSGCPTFGGEHFQLEGGALAEQDANSGIAIPSQTNTLGLLLPEEENEPKDRVTDSFYSFFYTAVMAGENMDFETFNVVSCTNAFDLMNAGGNLMVFGGVNNINSIAVVFQDVHNAGAIDASGLNVQENAAAGSATNWVLLNDPVNRLYGNIKLACVAGAYTGTNYGTVIGGRGVNIQRAFVAGGLHDVTYLNDGAYYVGGSLNGGFPQTNTAKFFPFLYYSYSNAPGAFSGPNAFMSISASSANENVLALGSAGGGNPDSISAGVNYIQFYTASSELANPVLDGYVDPNGNLFWQAAGASLSGFSSATFGQMTINSTSANSMTLNNGAGSGRFVIPFENNGTTYGTLVGVAGAAGSEGNAPNNSLAWLPTQLAGQAGFFGQPDGQFMTWSNINSGASVIATNGFGSLATNTLTMGSTGITNTLAVNVVVYGFNTSNPYWITNAATGFKAFFGASTPPMDHILKPGDAITGGTVGASGVRAF